MSILRNRAEEIRWLKGYGLEIGDKIAVTAVNGIRYVGRLKKIGMALGRIEVIGDDNFPFSFDAKVERAGEDEPVSVVAPYIYPDGMDLFMGACTKSRKKAKKDKGE